MSDIARESELKARGETRFRENLIDSVMTLYLLGRLFHNHRGSSLRWGEHLPHWFPAQWEKRSLWYRPLSFLGNRICLISKDFSQRTCSFCFRRNVFTKCPVDLHFQTIEGHLPAHNRSRHPYLPDFVPGTKKIAILVTYYWPFEIGYHSQEKPLKTQTHLELQRKGEKACKWFCLPLFSYS